MNNYHDILKDRNYRSMDDIFEPIDRVNRVYKYKNGKNKDYKGIILAIRSYSLEIYWDTRERKYRFIDSNIAFTGCSIKEIFKGNEEFTPIKKDRS